MTESASPPSIGYGSQDTLSVTGLPAGATGIVTFASGGASLCAVDAAGNELPDSDDACCRGPIR